MTDPADVAILTSFDKACLKLRRDVVSKCTFRDLDDSTAFLLAGSLLIGNRNLQSMTVIAGTEMTTLGAKALAKAIRKSNVKYLDLQRGDGGVHIPSSGVRMLYLEAMKSVRELVLGFELVNTDAQRLGKALRTNKSLEKLSLEVAAEHVTTVGAYALAEGIRNSRISDLRIHSATPEFYRILILEGIEPSLNINHLDISSDSGDEALSKILPSLQSLHVGLVNVETGVPLLCNGLRKSTQLETLELRDCPMNDQHMQLLATALQGNDILKVLRLSSAEFGMVGVNSLIASWKDGSQLEELRLHQNNIGPAGIQQLLKASSTHPHLKNLDVRSEHNIGYHGLTMIAEDLRHTKLSSFSVWVQEQSVTDQDSIEAQQWACNAASQALVKAVKSNFYLEKLSLNEIDISQAAKTEIEFYMKLNRSGRRLLMKDGLEASILWCNVLAKCRDDPSLMFYFLREQPILMSSFKNTKPSAKKRRFSNVLESFRSIKRHCSTNTTPSAKKRRFTNELESFRSNKRQRSDDLTFVTELLMDPVVSVSVFVLIAAAFRAINARC